MRLMSRSEVDAKKLLYVRHGDLVRLRPGSYGLSTHVTLWNDPDMSYIPEIWLKHDKGAIAFILSHVHATNDGGQFFVLVLIDDRAGWVQAINVMNVISP